MADPLRSTTPVSATSGFAPRSRGQERSEREPRSAEPGPRREADDRVQVAAGALAGRLLLRERVLVHTRARLGLPDHAFVPAFAEAIADESTATFLGRLLSAQNQLAAHRAHDWDGGALRAAVDAGLRSGAEEACELLAGDGRDPVALAAVAEVLVEYGRRLEALIAEAVDGETPSVRSGA